MSDEREMIEAMIMSPSSKDQFNTTFEEDLEEAEEKEELFKIDGDREMSDKYKEKLVDYALKHPDDVLIETPDGEMTMKEAIERGYDPATGQFMQEMADGRPKMEDHFGQLGPEDMAKMKQHFDPRNTDITPKEAERMGIDLESKGGKDFKKETKAPKSDVKPSELEELIGGGEENGE